MPAGQQNCSVPLDDGVDGKTPYSAATCSFQVGIVFRWRGGTPKQ